MNKVGKTKGYKKNKQDIVLDFFIYTFSLIMLFLTIYPFFYVIILSFNEGVGASFGGIYWWPRKFTLENYAKFFNNMKWLKGIGITVLRTLIGSVLGVFFTTLVSYACSFKELSGIIPYYAVLRSLHLIDTFWVYVIPGMLNLFFIMIGRGFFEGIPASLRESSKIDGATEFTIFKKIILPVSKPFVATLALFIGVGHWNNWYDSTFFVRNKNLKTLPYLMMEVINQNQTTTNVSAAAHQAVSGTTSMSIQLAAVVITILPIMCIYPFLQKYLVSGMMVGAVKE